MFARFSASPRAAWIFLAGEPLRWASTLLNAQTHRQSAQDCRAARKLEKAMMTCSWLVRALVLRVRLVGPAYKGTGIDNYLPNYHRKIAGFSFLRAHADIV